MKTQTHWRHSRNGLQRPENPLYADLRHRLVVGLANQGESLRSEHRRCGMNWTKMERKMVAETYRELWPGQVADMEIAMFCKALSYNKSDHVLEALYQIFASQDQRLRPAAGRVRERTLDICRMDPEEQKKKTSEEAPTCSIEEIREITRAYREKIGEIPKGFDD